MRRINSTVLIVFAMALISIMCLFFGVSYSYVLKSSSSGNTQQIETQNMAVNMTFQASDLELTPMSDDEGLEQDDYGIITVDAESDMFMISSLSIGYSKTLPVEIEQLVPLEYVRIGVFLINPDNPSEPILAYGPTAIADLPISKYDGNILNTQYLVGILPIAKNEGMGNFEIGIKVWLDENIDDTYNESLVYLDASIDRTPLLNKNMYSISGTVSYNGTPAPGAIVIVSGLYPVIADSDGSYSIAGIPEGLWKLQVAYNNNIYETVLNIVGDNELTLTEISPASITAGTSTQQAAYEHKTTPYMILKNNPVLDNSNSTTLTSYTTPISYELKTYQKIGDQDIENFNINIVDGQLHLEYEVQP